MEIKIKGTMIELTPAIEAAVQEKIGGLEKYFDNIIGCEVEVGRTTMHHQKGDVFMAEVNLEVPKTLLRASAEAEDLYQAINDARDKMKQEITKYKEMMRGE